MTTLAGITTIKDLPIENQRVFIRVDFNVPLEEQDGKQVITDDARIVEALPTIKHAMDRGARVLLASHLGRPKKGPDPKLSIEPCGSRLAELLGVEVHVPEDCIGDAAKKVVFDLRAGQVCLLENLRFHPEEEKDDEAFALKLAELCDVYVDDAFGAVHRAHASVHALPKQVRERGCGFLLEKEIAALGKIVSNPDKPFIAVLGGAKVSDKIAVLESLLEKVDALIIGGAMANTFLAARGANVQASKVEDDKLALARTILEKAREKKVDLVLPIDVVVAQSIAASEGTTVDVGAIPEGFMALDIGPKTIAKFQTYFDKAKSVFWNGPMGLFEKPAFSNGTFSVARALAASSAFTVIGGGDSASAVKEAGDDVAKKFSHISTGGGASLELIEGKKLPGIEVLRR
jgi:phosphoglycerate kinase